MASSSWIHWFTSQGMCDVVTPPFCNNTSQQGGCCVENNIVKRYGYTACLARRSLLQKSMWKEVPVFFVALELRQTAKLSSSEGDLNDTNAGVLRILNVVRFIQLIFASKIKVPKIR